MSGAYVTPAGETNYRLALLGDKFAAAAMVQRWYPTGEPKKHGQDAIDSLNNRDLASLANSIGLADVLTLNMGMQRATAARARTMMATALVAVLGAIYLDSGNDLATLQAVLARLGL